MLSLGLWFPTENIDECFPIRNFFFVNVATARDERMAERGDQCVASIEDDVRQAAIRALGCAEITFAELPRAQCLYTASLTPRGAS